MELNKENEIKSKNCDIDKKIVSKKYEPASRYSFDLINLIGFLKGLTDIDSLKENYGITYEEFLNPTKETLEKVRDYLKNKKIKKRF